MLVLSKSLGLLLIFSQLLFTEKVGYAGPRSSSSIACVIKSKEAEISITLEDRSAHKRRKILGHASVELKEGRFSNLKAEKSETCLFSSVSCKPGLEEIISIKYGEGVSFLLKPNHELELIKLQMPQSDLNITAPLSEFILANATHLRARSLTVSAQEATNRAAVKIEKLHIRGGLFQNYGQIESLKEDLSIFMNDNALLNMKNGNIYSKSNLSVFDVSTLTNEGIIKTYEKGLCTIEGRHFYNTGKIYHAGEFFSNMKEGYSGLLENIEFCPPIKKRKFSIDSGVESDGDFGMVSDSGSGRPRSSSFSSILSDCEYAEILSESSGNMSDFWSEAEEDSEQKNTMGEELVGKKPAARFPRRALARFPGRAVSSTSEALISPRGAGRSLIKTSPRFNVLRGPIKNAQHKVSSTTARTPSLPELRGGSEKTAPSPGFEDKLASLDSMSSLRDGASKNPISKSFETPEEQKIISSKLDNLLIHALKVLNTAGRKFSEIFFRKGPVYKFSMILWEIFLTFKHWFILCAICGLLLFGVRKVLLFFKDALEADV